ncbi:MAG: LamG domain-containing protein, partial [Nanoarchaeota archaeon]|nr:LamG domain-containing protein [Nanoarchaeota archaeon]
MSTSNSLTIQNTVPTHSNPVLTSTNPATNDLYQNLTAYNQSTADIDGDSVKNIYNWLKDGSSIAVLNVPFEASANLYNATDYAGFDNNATSLYGSPIYNQTGGYDGKGAYEFSTADETIYLATNNFPTIGTGNYTIMAWVKTSGNPTGGYQCIFSITTLAGNYDPGFYIGGGDKLRIYDNGNIDSNAGFSINDDNWHHVAFVREGTDSNQLKFYLDGDPIGSATHSASILSATSLTIGWDLYAGEDFEGTIDEFMLLNSSLSAEQILALYNNRSDLIVSQETNVGDSWSVQITPNDREGDGTTLTSNSLVVQDYVDATDPSITVLSPTEGSWYYPTVNLTYTVSDNVAVDSCWYSLDGGANTTLSGCANTSVSLGRGPHNITFYVNDTTNNQDASSLISFDVNSLPTVDSLILNTTNPATNDTNQNLTVYNTTSDADSDSVKVIYNWLVNGTSQLLFNVPFEVSADSFNATDYSSFGVDPSTILGSPVYNPTGGHDGRGAYQFNGDQSAISFDASSFPVIGTGNYTFEAWVKTISDKLWQTIWIMEDADKHSLLGFYVYTNSGTGGSRIYIANNDIYKASSINNNLIDGAWHHVAFVREGNDTGQLKFYIDGVQHGTNTDAFSQPAPASIYVGWDNIGGAPADFNGTFDEVRLWNRSLSAEQILALYNNRTDLIVSNETSVGDNWTVQGTPNDGKEDGVVVTSNQVLIQEVPNTIPEVTTPVITPTTAYTDSALTANTTYTDAEGSSGTVYFLWYVNGANTYNQTNTSIAGGTTVIATLNSGNFSKNNQVSVSVYANDGTDDSSLLESGTVTIQNSLPTQSNPILNTTNPATNDTNQNLTAYNQSTADVDGDSVKNVYNWMMNGSPIAVLNMPFEGGSNSTFTKDYSGLGNNGSITGAIWNSTGGYGENGAYEFNGSTYIDIPDSDSFTLNNFSVLVWIKIESSGSVDGVFHSWTNDEGSGQWFGFEEAGGLIRFNVDDGIAITGTTASTDVKDGSWHQVVGVRDENNNVSIYIDGLFETSSPETPAQINPENFHVGKVPGFSRYVNGTIDEVVIWNRSLSAEQILALYNNRT